jgi:hypothetical protein
MSRSELSDIRARSIKSTGAGEHQGAQTFTGAESHAGANTFLAASTVILQSTVPSTFTAAGEPGQIAATNTSPNTATSAFLYVCYASNTWARIVCSGTAFA